MRSLMRERSELNLFFMQIFGVCQLEMERRLESLVFRDSRSCLVEFMVEITPKQVRTCWQRMGHLQTRHAPGIANMTANSRKQ